MGDAVDQATSAVERIPVLAISDAPVNTTGFGRVLRELFMRLPQDRFRLGVLAEGWVGTSRMPGVVGYTAHPDPRGAMARDRFCRESFVPTLQDFAPEGPVLLWTLLDCWQTAWLSFWDRPAHMTMRNKRYFSEHRKRLRWIGHFPIDGRGQGEGPPLWVADYVNQMDHAVFMSEFGRRITKPNLRQELPTSFITHAVDTDVFTPGDRLEARKEVNLFYTQHLAIILAGQAMVKGEKPDAEKIAAEVKQKAFLLHDDDHVVVCVMANRSRKYWPQALEAFKALADKAKNAKLIALCGDREGRSDDAWPLAEFAHKIGLRVDRIDDYPNVWLVEAVGNDPMTDGNAALALLYKAADQALLWGGGEGFGLPQLEAHACGLPCIVGVYSASEELIVDSREGVTPRGFQYTGLNLVKRPYYSTNDLVDRLHYAWKNPGWRHDVGAKGAAQGIIRSWPNVLPLWIALMEEEFARGRAADSPAIPL